MNNLEQRLLDTILNDEDDLKFIKEVHVQNDIFDQYFEYQGIKFSIPVYGNERYTIDDPDLIEIHEQK